MITQEEFLLNLEELNQRIEQACSDCGRNREDVCLLPVTKNWPIDAVRYCKEAGMIRVGENRVQEALVKKGQISGVSWELIGHLQSNKVNQVVGCFSRIQTLDSLKLIRKVNTAAEHIDQKISVLLQVNAGNDPAKYGFSLKEAVSVFEEAIGCSHLLVEGLMTIAPYAPDDLSVARDCFEKLAELRNTLLELFGIELRELSMGMTDDLHEAIACGSTMIRVGSALFGTRMN